MTDRDTLADGSPAAEIGPVSFRRELAALINKHCGENGSNTPDYLLADYLGDCLSAFDRTVAAREQWHGRDPEWNRGFGVGIGGPDEPTPAEDRK